MPDQPADPFLPGDIGSIAVVTLYRGLVRAGGGMVGSALIVGAITAMNNLVTQEQQQEPPAG